MSAIADEVTQEYMTGDGSQPRPSAIVAGRYEVDLNAPLGSGGMATVYKGRDLRTRRTVALKTLRLEYRRDPDTRARFRHEARLMAFVTHPNLVRVYDLHEEQEAPWVVMEYIPGRTLKDLLAERGPFRPAEVADFLDQIAGALAHLHGRKLVHLDIKPQNLLVTPDGILKLIDFGLAQPAGTSQELIGGATFGTAAYLAPEQARGDAVDAATDVYALGCVVYELLTGQPPFHSTALGDVKNDVIRAHIEQKPTPPTETRPDLKLPAWIDDVLSWALAKQPTDRYRDVTSFARLFREGVEGEALRGAATTMPITPIDIPKTDTPRRPQLRLQPRAAAASPSLTKRSAHGLYRVGGRIARRMRLVRGLLWKLTAVFAIGNVLLALILLANGGPSALLSRTATLGPGATAIVTIDDLNIRQNAGTTAPILTMMSSGDRLAITGPPIPIGNDLWWPVAVEQNGVTIPGYAWGPALEPTAWTGRLAWVQDLIDRGASTRDAIGNRIESVRTFLP